MRGLVAGAGRRGRRWWVPVAEADGQELILGWRGRGHRGQRAERWCMAGAERRKTAWLGGWSTAAAFTTTEALPSGAHRMRATPAAGRLQHASCGWGTTCCKWMQVRPLHSLSLSAAGACCWCAPCTRCHLQLDNAGGAPCLLPLAHSLLSAEGTDVGRASMGGVSKEAVGC